MTTTRLPSCRVATSTLRMAMPGTNRMLPSCSREAASSEGSNTKVELSLLMLRMDFTNAACSIFTTFSREGGLKDIPRSGRQIGREVQSG